MGVSSSIIASRGQGLFGRHWRFLVVAFRLASLVLRPYVQLGCLLLSAGAAFPIDCGRFELEGGKKKTVCQTLSGAKTLLQTLPVA